MSIKDTVENLRSNGWNVHTKHYRPDVTYPETIHEYNRHTKIVVPATCGGFTTVTLISPSGTAFAGNAICHETDTFNYKRGRKIALHRAMVDAGLKKVVKGRQVIVGDYITLSGESVSGWKDQILSFYRDKPLAELKKTVENEWAFPKEIPDMYIHNVLEGKE
jgi:hypothetical protein